MMALLIYLYWDGDYEHEIAFVNTQDKMFLKIYVMRNVPLLLNILDGYISHQIAKDRKC